MDLKNSNIAIATDDGVTVSSHFGRAMFYEIVQFKDGKAIRRNRVEKAGHHTFAKVEGVHEHYGDHHNQEEHNNKHQQMIAPILNCAAVIVRGMGQGAVEHLRRCNIVAVLTQLHTIEEVINAISKDSLDNDPSRIHMHHHA